MARPWKGEDVEMRAQVTLTSSESKRLIGRAVSEMPEVKKALRQGFVVIARGTTNAYVVEEILKTSIERGRYTVGVVTGGRTTLNPPEVWLPEVVLKDGRQVQMTSAEAVSHFSAGDVFIKGANAVDPSGMAGILMTSPTGGTIGAALGAVASRGAHLIVPVGLEKLVPSVVEAAAHLGTQTIDRAIGSPCGMMPLAIGKVVTEIQALNILFGVRAVHVASGGVGGSEGAVTLVLEGEAEAVNTAMDYLESIKSEPPVAIPQPGAGTGGK